MIIVMWLRHILKINIIKICDFLTTSMSATPMVFTRRSKDSIDIFFDNCDFSCDNWCCFHICYYQSTLFIFASSLMR